MISPQPPRDHTGNGLHLPHEKLEAILAAGALDAIRENQRFGLPVISERDGQIVHVDAFEAEAELLKSFPDLATKSTPSFRATP